MLLSVHLLRKHQTFIPQNQKLGKKYLTLNADESEILVGV